MEDQHIERALGRVEGKVDRLEQDIKDIKFLLQEGTTSISTRVNSLEQSRSKLLGTVGAISAVFGVVGSWLAANLLPRIPH